MPPTPTLKSKPDEKDIELLDYSSAINQLNVIAKKELEETKNQINTSNYHLAMLKDNITKQTNEFERWKKSEKLKFDNELNTIKNDIIYKQNLINNEVIQQERITADLRTQQVKFEALKQDQLRLREDLVKLEGRKIEIENLHRQAESIKSSAITSQNQGSMALAKAAEDAERNKQENIRLSALNDSLSQREKKLEEDIRNYQTLKDFVEPKVKDIQEQQQALDKAKVENEATISKLQATMNEEKILLQSVLDKKAQLEKDMKSFVSEKEEYLRNKTLTEGIK